MKRPPAAALVGGPFLEPPTKDWEPPVLERCRHQQPRCRPRRREKKPPNTRGRDIGMRLFGTERCIQFAFKVHPFDSRHKLLLVRETRDAGRPAAAVCRLRCVGVGNWRFTARPFCLPFVPPLRGGIPDPRAPRRCRSLRPLRAVRVKSSPVCRHEAYFLHSPGRTSIQVQEDRRSPQHPKGEELPHGAACGRAVSTRTSRFAPYGAAPSDSVVVLRTATSAEYRTSRRW